MDVQCERCKTEYEFDDALVSGRGTTVRCTTCGHQFKVRRASERTGETAGEDRWLVKTANGHQFTFVTLRELQRAILAHQVSKTDLLRRAGAPPRPLGSISELEPFFEGRTSSNRAPPPDPGDAAPAAPPAFPKRSSITFEAEPATSPNPQPRATASYGQAPPPPMRRKTDTLRPLGAAAPPQAAPIVPQPIVPASPLPPAPESFHEAPTAVERIADMREVHAPPPRQPPPPEVPSSLPPPTRPVRPRPSSGSDFAEMRPSIPSSALEEPYSMRRGRRVGGWIVALVLLLAVGVLGWAIARPYIVARNASAAAQLDPRAEGFLADGEKAMGDGNLEQARESFDKASALAESDPRVRLDQARVATAQADVPWLKLKLLPATAVDEVRTTKADMSDRVARASALADAAVASAPDAPAAVRVKIDALRLAGQQDAARGLVAKVIAQASQPETAYVLAALDLAEPEPLWTTVLERLRLAAAGEGAAGRARAALVYSLAKSGDTTGSRTELAKLDTLARAYPLSPELHALVDKMPSKGSPDAGTEAPAARGPAAAAVATNASPPAPPAGAAPAAGDGIPADSRSAMQAAAQAYKKGDFARARQVYEAVVARNPTDSEAVAALGDVSRAQGDSAGAIASYKRAITVNPSYLPALLGLADTQWASGDKAGALRGYSDIADRFPEGTYPAYVKQRVEGGSAPAAAPAAPTENPKSPSAASDESSP
jgi:predicted Zn finger-like uncharacterized protein